MQKIHFFYFFLPSCSLLSLPASKKCFARWLSFFPEFVQKLQVRM